MELDPLLLFADLEPAATDSSSSEESKLSLLADQRKTNCYLPSFSDDRLLLLLFFFSSSHMVKSSALLRTVAMTIPLWM